VEKKKIFDLILLTLVVAKKRGGAMERGEEERKGLFRFIYSFPLWHCHYSPAAVIHRGGGERRKEKKRGGTTSFSNSSSINNISYSR